MGRWTSTSFEGNDILHKNTFIKNYSAHFYVGSGAKNGPFLCKTLAILILIFFYFKIFDSKSLNYKKIFKSEGRQVQMRSKEVWRDKKIRQCQAGSPVVSGVVNQGQPWSGVVSQVRSGPLRSGVVM